MIMIIVITTITILIACTVGAIVGFGGGIIIKPVMDSMGFCSIDTVNFISSCAVLAMSISSIIRHRIQKTPVDKKIVLCMAAGAVAGGYCGNSLFSLVLKAVGGNVTKSIQAIMIIVLVAFAVYYVNKKEPRTFNIKNPAAMVVTGLVLGTLNSFFGIGGGPINITVLLLMFSLAVKDGAVYSIAIVFFCQLSNMITLFCKNQFEPYAQYLPLIICAVIAAVAGGLAGSTLNKKLSDKTIKGIFSVVMAAVFAVNVYNAVTGLI